jgi:hypothetical protein
MGLFKPRAAMLYEIEMATELELLRTGVDTLFVTSAAGRIKRSNDPDRSIGPKLFFAGCAKGNLACVRHDIDEETAAKLLGIAANEPPGRDPRTLPQCIGKLLDTFSNTPLWRF